MPCPGRAASPRRLIFTNHQSQWLCAGRSCKGLLGALLALVVLLWAVKAYSDAHYFDNYDPSAPLNIAMGETTEVNRDTPEKGYTITRFTFDAYQGEKIPTLISLPMNRSGKKLPVVVFLHGIGQNKNFLKEITAPFNQVGFAFVCFDQYTQGERKLGGKKSFLAESGGVRGNGPPRPSTKRGGSLIIS